MTRKKDRSTFKSMFGTWNRIQVVVYCVPEARGL